MQKPDTELHFISTIEDFSNLNAYVESENFSLVAFDLETDSVVEKRAKIYGIGLCFQPGQAFYIPIRKPTTEKYWDENTESDIISTLQSWLARIPVVGHNILFDNLVWEANYSINFDANIKSDTMLMKHAIDEERPFGLKDVGVQYLGAWADKAQDELKENVLNKGGSWNAENKQMFLADTEILGKYCMWDVLLTRWIYDIFAVKIKEQGLTELFESETMNLYREVTIPMKRHGFPINVAHFEKLQKDIAEEILGIEDKVQEAIADMVAPFCQTVLDKKIPIKPSGKFREALAYAHGVPIPVNKKTGKATFAATALQKVKLENPTHNNFYSWCEGTAELDLLQYPTDAVQQQLFFEVDEEARYVFNLSSNDHLGWLFFNHLQLEPLGKTDGGKPKCDDDFLMTIEKEFPWISDLLTFKRLRKLEATYILGVLSRHVDGRIHASMQQVGTTSGRYSCTSPNLQNLPRIKDEEEVSISPLVLKYANAIKEGFIAPEGYSIVNADQEALEAKCLHENTRILTDKGIKYAKDVAINDNVWTKFGFRRITNKWESKKVGVQFLTNTGELITSLEHKLWDKKSQSWKEARDFKVGDEFESISFSSIDSNINKVTLPIYSQSALTVDKRLPMGTMELTEDLAWAIGAFLGDGVAGFNYRKTKGIKKNGAGFQGYVGICGLEEDGVVQEFEKVWNNYGYFFSTSYDNRKTLPFLLTTYRGTDLLNIFANTLNLIKCGTRKGKGSSKLFKVPDYIMNATTNYKLAFLAGLIDTDGTIGSRKENGRDLVIYTHSPTFASDIILLLNSMKLDSRITYTIKDQKHFGCQVRITADAKHELINSGIQKHMRCLRKSNQLKIGKKGFKNSGCEIKYIFPIKESRMFDFEVEEVHEFMAANVRVHNCFADRSEDLALQEVFHKGYDLYSQVAIRTFNLEGVSADKKAENYLGKVNKEKRGIGKIIALAIAFGAEAGRISQILNISWEEANEIVQNYLAAFPSLHAYMTRCNYEAKHKGMVRTEFGRIRHLTDCMWTFRRYGDNLLNYKYVQQNGLQRERAAFKNALNNAKNFPIQGLAAHIMNRGLIAVARRIKAEKLDAHIVAQTHDEATLIARTDQAAQIATILKDCLENTTKIAVPLKAEPIIAKNWAEAK